MLSSKNKLLQNFLKIKAQLYPGLKLSRGQWFPRGQELTSGKRQKTHLWTTAGILPTDDAFWSTIVKERATALR
jgi:hypothetical protein